MNDHPSTTSARSKDVWALAGRGAFLVECGRILLQREHPIAAVISEDVRLHEFADASGLPRYATMQEWIDTGGTVDFLAAVMVEDDLSAALPRINHAALRFQDGPACGGHIGWHAPAWAILTQVPQHGICWLKQGPTGFAGAVAEKRFDLEAGLDARALATRCFDEGLVLFASLLDRLAADAAAADAVTPYDSRFHETDEPPPDAGLIDLHRPASSCQAVVSALGIDGAENTFASARIALGTAGSKAMVFLLPMRAEIETDSSDHPPGTILGADHNTLTLAVADSAVRFSALRHEDGRRADVPALLSALGIQVGDVLPRLGREEINRLLDESRRAAPVERLWRQRLEESQPLECPMPLRSAVVAGVQRQTLSVSLAPVRDLITGHPCGQAALIAAFFARIGDRREFDLGFCRECPKVSLLASVTPLRLLIDPETSLHELLPALAESIDTQRHTPPFRRDLIARTPGLSQRLGRGEDPTIFPITLSLEGPVDRPLPQGAVCEWILDNSETLTLAFDASRLSPADAQALLASFRLYSAEAAADPSAPLWSIPLLDAQERRRILIDFNDNAKPYPFDRCLHQHVEDVAVRLPDHIAVEFEGMTLTYGELDRRANRLAHLLREHGVKPDDVVGICMERCLEMPLAVLAVWKAGAAYVPLDPAYPRARLADLLTDTQTRIVLCDDRFLNLFDAAFTLIPLSHFDSHTRTLPETPPQTGVTADNLSYVINTSGSTGRPKAVATDHRAIANNLLWMQDQWPLTPEDRLLQKTSFSFDVSVKELIWPLIAGSRLVLARPGGEMDPEYLCALMRDAGITITHFVPTMLDRVLREPAARQCNSLRLLMCGAETLPIALKRRFFDIFNADLLHLYGPTEAAIAVTAWLCRADDRDEQQERVPLGFSMPNVRIHLLDSHLQPVPVGVPGELFIGGVALARGYLNRPDETARRFIPDPFSGNPADRLYATGDLARYLPDGNIEFLGRKDHQVKVRGFRIELGEIESRLVSHPAIRQAAVRVWETPGAEKRLAAYYVTESAAQPPTDADLRAFLRETLPHFMIPSHFHRLERMPLTTSGKIDRNALPAVGSRRPETGRPLVLPRNAAERALAEIFAEVLGYDRVGVQDAFLDLGGSSLSAVRLFGLIRERLGTHLPLSTLFAAPTVETLAKTIEQEAAGGLAGRWKSLVPLKPSGSRRPLYFIHPAGGNVLFYHELAKHLPDDMPLYGIQSRGLDGEEEPLTTVEAMAEAYLEEIRSLQPEGPYFVCGASFGGLIAYEIAQRLTAMGETLGLLCMVDTYGPDFREPTKWLRVGYKVADQMRPLLTLPLKEKLEFVRKRARRIKGKIASKVGQGEEIPYHLRAIFIANAAADDQYVAKPYPGTLHLFKGTIQPSGGPKEPGFGWEKYVAEVVPIEIPGDHLTMGQEEGSIVMAGHLQRILYDVESRVLV